MLTCIEAASAPRPVWQLYALDLGPTSYCVWTRHLQGEAEPMTLPLCTHKETPLLFFAGDITPHAHPKHGADKAVRPHTYPFHPAKHPKQNAQTAMIAVFDETGVHHRRFRHLQDAISQQTRIVERHAVFRRELRCTASWPSRPCTKIPRA